MKQLTVIIKSSRTTLAEKITAVKCVLAVALKLSTTILRRYTFRVILVIITCTAVAAFTAYLRKISTHTTLLDLTLPYGIARVNDSDLNIRLGTPITFLEEDRLLTAYVRGIAVDPPVRGADHHIARMVNHDTSSLAMNDAMNGARAPRAIALDTSSGHMLSAEARTVATIQIINKVNGQNCVVMDHKNSYLVGDHLLISNEVNVRYQAVGDARHQTQARIIDLNPTTIKYL